MVASSRGRPVSDRPAVEERVVGTSGGGILYDASKLRKPDDALFTRAHWKARGALREQVGGRGSIAIVRAGEQSWVLRHYRRGGWAAKVSNDRYWWLDADRTRAFAEWRLLAELRRRGLPVPAPIAARYVRGLLTYRADLITEEVPSARTLADAISGSALAPEVWRAAGKTIAAFHREGVHHADLNAHNILLRIGAGEPDIYLLDFDRGRLRARGAWEAEVLARLRRSLEKISRTRADVHFGEREWLWLMEGYGGGSG
jgi:3-deoxy-D-manno-octulosonic acid kinase